MKTPLFWLDPIGGVTNAALTMRMIKKCAKKLLIKNRFRIAYSHIPDSSNFLTYKKTGLDWGGSIR